MKLDLPRATAVIGFVAWLGLPLALRERFASLPHLFLFMPLVLAPLAFDLVDALRGERGAGLAARLQPFGALAVASSFVAPPGALAGALAVVWSVVALFAAGRALRKPRELGIVVACVFLVIGSVWLVLARGGAAPFGFASTTVHLAALHFHFSGFVLQVILAAMRRRLTNGRMRVAHRVVTFGALVAIPVIAIGNASSSPTLKLIGVVTMTASTLLLVPLSFGVSCAADRAAKVAMRVAAGALLAAMLLAGAYGVSEHAGHPWMTVDAMARTHGLLNACGFALAALVAQARIVKRGDTAACRKDRQPSGVLGRLTLR